MSSDDGIQDPMVRALSEYIAHYKFQRPFEQFFLDNALQFTDEDEHRLNYMSVYLEFQQLFNDHMAIFLASQEVTEEEFAARCQKAMQRDSRASTFLDIVLASTDYDAFISLMRFMRVRASVDTECKSPPRKRSAEDHDRDAKAPSKRDDDDDDGDRKLRADDDDGKDSK